MKKIFASIAFTFLFSVAALAGLPLKGTWNMSQSISGTTVSDYLTFDNDTEGQVVNKFVISLKMSVLGIKITGGAEVCVSGTFVSDGDKLSIKWDRESYTDSKTPLTVTYKGEAMDDDEGYDEILDEIVDEIKKGLDESDEDEYYNVRVKGVKLYMTSDDEKGKPSTDKFTKVK